MLGKTDPVKLVQTSVQAELPHLKDLIGSVWFVLAEVPQLTQADRGPGLLSIAGAVQDPYRSCLLSPAVPAVTPLLPTPLLASSYRLVPALCSAQDSLCRLPFIPCMIAEVFSSFCPGTCDSVALSWRTSCISPCLLMCPCI